MDIDEATIKKALQAFKKRLKITQLEEDSRLGRSPLSGPRSKVAAIRPPLGFAAEVWPRLCELGHLKDDGGGFYMLTGK